MRKNCRFEMKNLEAAVFLQMGKMKNVFLQVNT